MPRWTLADVLDLEAQLARDRALVRAQCGAAVGLEERDRLLGAELRAAAPDAGDGALLHAWVRALRARDPSLPGRRLAGLRPALRALALLAGALVGGGVAAAVLRYEGGRPIPLLVAVGVLVLLPVATFLLALALRLPVVRRLAAATGGPVQWLLGRIAASWGARLLPADEPPGWHAELAHGLARRGERGPLYAPLARALLGELASWAGLAAALAALGVLLALVVGTDLAFGWGTTLEVDPGWLRRWVDLLAAPWGWAWPAAVPDDELIAASRYLRLEDRFVAAGDGRALDPLRLGAWWRFLAASMLTWAVLPRLAASLVALAGARRRLAAQDARSAAVGEHRAVAARLRGERAAFTAAPPRHAPADAPPATTAEPGDPPPPGRPAAVCWDEACAVEDLPALARANGCELGGPVCAAGHGADAAVDAAAVRALAGAEAAIVVVGRAQPLAEARAFLRDLRGALGDRPLAVATVGADPALRREWRDALRALRGDNRLLAWEDAA